jgi:tetratricopeptide (TPR) repeat protein
LQKNAFYCKSYAKYPTSNQWIPSAMPFQEQVHTLIALYGQGQLQEALILGEELLAINPSAVTVLSILGAVNAAMGRKEEAVLSCSKAVQIKPNYAEGYNNLGNALSDLGMLDTAVSSYCKALQIKPDFAEALNNLGNAYNVLGKLNEAVASYERALQLIPDYAVAHNNLGSALQGLGMLDEAVASYNKAILINPDYTEAHSNLSKFVKYEEGNQQLAQLLELLKQSNLSIGDQISLNFTLGKAYDDMRNYDQAFSHIRTGNSLLNNEIQYDITKDEGLFSKIKSTFQDEISPVKTAALVDDAVSQRPVFILGMPRSGTTLVEQILASHSEVFGGGELELLNNGLQNIDWPTSTIEQSKVLQLKEDYLSGLSKLGTTERFITDKMPLNFRWIGFILSAFPEAKIIHVKRDAMAICWSIFKQNFSQKGNSYAYDLENIAQYYQLYCDLMEFWNNKFPTRIYNLCYENLIEDQENETRNLLEYVGLDWEEQCLEFHKTKRAISTASSLQVRQKLYKGSSEQWRNYEKHLAPLDVVKEVKH